MKKGLSVYPLILGSILLSACQSFGGGTSNEEAVNGALYRLDVTMGSRVNSVSNFMISGWQEINDRNLIITSGLHDHYLVTLFAPCMELPFAFSIALQSRTSSLSSGDDIIVNSIHRRPLERCKIDEIYRLVDRE